MYRKTYVSVKKYIDDWLRQVKVQEISVNELKNYKFLRSFTREFLRELKQPSVSSLQEESTKNDLNNAL